MNVKVLIDELIRNTTVMIAQLATTAGIRAPLSHVANQVFLDLVRELEGQGVSKKVAADMFGLALRSYQLKVQRLSESATERERSLWEAVFDYIRDHDIVSRAEVLRHFCHDDVASVKGILNDLLESNLIFQTGRGKGASYRAVAPEELDQLVARDEAESAPWQVWSVIYHRGQLQREELGQLISLDDDVIARALDQLLADGRIQHDDDGYSCRTIVIPMDEPAGWEAALYGHVNAMFTAMTIKLRQLRTRTMPEDIVGGSTYFFDLGPDHPYREEVLGLLRETRARISSLRGEVTAYNDRVGRADEAERVIFYFGQAVIRHDDDGSEEPH